MNRASAASPWKRLPVYLRRLEDGLLVGLLLAMIGLAVAQIVLRNIFGAGLVWGDGVVRVMVLWIGLLGAMAASRAGNHIRIDVLARSLPAARRRWAACIAEIFTAIICALAAYYSLKFVRMEYVDGGLAVGRIPAWVCEAIIPLAFAVIGLRYALLAFQKLTRAGASV